MVPTELFAGKFPLAVVGPAKFAAPNHKRVFQEPTTGKIGHQRCGWLVRLLALSRDRFD